MTRCSSKKSLTNEVEIPFDFALTFFINFTFFNMAGIVERKNLFHFNHPELLLGKSLSVSTKSLGKWKNMTRNVKLSDAAI